MNLMLSGSLGKVLIPKTVKAFCEKEGKRIGLGEVRTKVLPAT